MICWKSLLLVLALEAHTKPVTSFVPAFSNGVGSSGGAAFLPHTAPAATWASSSSSMRMPPLSMYRLNDDHHDNNGNGNGNGSSDGKNGAGAGKRGGGNGNSDSNRSDRNGASRGNHPISSSEGARDASPTHNFITGDDLHRLRHHVLALRLELQEARSQNDASKVEELGKAIFDAQQSDAEFIYHSSLKKMKDAQLSGNFAESLKWKQASIEARQALPQFQLAGLWVGKYNSDADYEMINVTYDGDILTAHKVTGTTKNVPKGQVTFQVDLSSAESLMPIELGDAAAKQWGNKYLQRYQGIGQVASENFQDSQFIDGQLILVNDYFSFAWLPIGHQVFFGRPTDELIMKLLSVPQQQQDDTRLFLEKCWDDDDDDIDDDDEAPS
eukprot:CAMPEP_0119559512 /NCGR_PEP_ID=MMETSP1352-20130426/12806_1 /TAXON_ID=265584 /ORGANISM="Stauroneis constricta, Strain CCMP1120" /LENGTH=384 /DNA_ID=CAMNT_0007607241 /DNA_START=268 /DNA_END=1418 /DNA_ORIENTATION=-